MTNNIPLRSGLHSLYLYRQPQRRGVKKFADRILKYWTVENEGDVKNSRNPYEYQH